MSTVGTDGLGHEQLDLKNTFRIRQVYQPNTNVNTNIQFHKWSNTNLNEKNRVFEYRHKCNYVFDPNPDVCFVDHSEVTCGSPHKAPVMRNFDVFRW